MDANEDVVHEVWIPSLYRDLTGAKEIVEVPGATVGQVIAELDRRYPGIEARLCQDGRLRPNISVAVNGTISYRGVRQRLNEASEVHFVPALSGG